MHRSSHVLEIQAHRQDLGWLQLQPSMRFSLFCALLAHDGRIDYNNDKALALSGKANLQAQHAWDN
jgi:hypothetical protein